MENQEPTLEVLRNTVRDLLWMTDTFGIGQILRLSTDVAMLDECWLRQAGTQHSRRPLYSRRVFFPPMSPS